MSILVSSQLTHIGYDAFFSEQMAKLSSHLLPARIVGQHRRQWDVATETGVERAVLAGKRWSPDLHWDLADTQPTVGDWVAINRADTQSPPVIEQILTRRTWLTRTSPAKRGIRQTLVANIDRVAVVAAFAPHGSHDAVAKRSLHPRRIERYLTAIEKGGAEPLIVLNKSDLSPEAEERAADLKKRLGNCTVICVNCTTDSGLNPLRDLIAPGETIGFVGLSGVGKSSIVNRILGRDAQKIGEERGHDARGRHTTTHRELFITPSGVLLIDTPGMREFALASASEADLSAFSDIQELSQTCQFRDCTHRDEPGCEVNRAVQTGVLERDRWQSYLALAEELRDIEKKAKEDPRRKASTARKKLVQSRRNPQHWDDE